jgi:DNA modification methylase
MVETVKEVRDIVFGWIKRELPDLSELVAVGLPEVDDRYDLWRVPLVLRNGNNNGIGEIKVNKEGKIVGHTKLTFVRARIKKWQKNRVKGEKEEKTGVFRPAPVPNKVILGDACTVLEELPRDTAQLVITSPPYFNAKPECIEYVDYQEYLDFLRRAIVRTHAILSEGRFFVINVSPILIRRTSRQNSSKRIALPFDVHRIMDSAGFEFIDDIIWVKPEGAGWNTGRGRRFAADRQPLQYKPVPVTEYVLVYRKKTDRLIDWNIRRHYDKSIVQKSKIQGEYDVTNVWQIPPGHHKKHPAVFPDELIHKLIRYYSFIDDLVLDPFAGTGTVGRVAIQLKRRFLLIDNNPLYFRVMKTEIGKMSLNLRVDYEVHEDFKDFNSEKFGCQAK